MGDGGDGSPTANVVGATASTMLVCDEAQDILISKWDKDINPMAASTNATKVFYGTAWTSQTLLARELATAKEAQQKDGLKRVFVVTADQVRKEVPAYGQFVDSEIAKHGRNHPLVRTQYFSETIDAESGLFPATRQALMHGSHPPLDNPIPGRYMLSCSTLPAKMKPTLNHHSRLANSSISLFCSITKPETPPHSP